MPASATTGRSTPQRSSASEVGLAGALIRGFGNQLVSLGTTEILAGEPGYGQRPGRGSCASSACQSSRTGDQTSTSTAPSGPTATSCGTFAGIRQVEPGTSSRVSPPTVNRIDPCSRIPTCSFSWACSGTSASGSSSSRESVTRSPWTVRPVTPSQICWGPSEPISAKALTIPERYRWNLCSETGTMELVRRTLPLVAVAVFLTFAAQASSARHPLTLRLAIQQHGTPREPHPPLGDAGDLFTT